MVYFVAVVAYVAIVVGGIRFFQTVRAWDDKARFLMQRDVLSRHSKMNISTSRRRALPVSS